MKCWSLDYCIYLSSTVAGNLKGWGTKWLSARIAWSNSSKKQSVQPCSKYNIILSEAEQLFDKERIFFKKRDICLAKWVHQFDKEEHLFRSEEEKGVLFAYVHGPLHMES